MKKRVSLPNWMQVNERIPYTQNPDRTLWEYVKSWTGHYTEKDTADWIGPRNEVLEQLHLMFTDPTDPLDPRGMRIPIGTKLYHGTRNANLDIQRLKDKITFLGLEPMISIWYTAEEYGRGKFGYVYEFEVVRPIPIDYIIPDLATNPKDVKLCVKGAVCVHPQITFHNVDESGPKDLSVEVTLMLKKMINNGYLRLIQRFRTSIQNLKEMVDYPLQALDLWLVEDLFLLQPN
jgi:hypothetical protein